MSASVSRRAYAKINLFLRIVGAKDGYHLIESLMQSIDLFDEVTLEKRADDLVTSDFPEDNSLVVLRRLKQEFALGGMHLSTKKKIPIGGGLGGSSADAAAAALACADLWGLKVDQVKKIVAPLFGDLAFQLTGGTAIARGFGEEVEPLPDLPTFAVLLALPEKGVSTKEAYALSDTLPKGNGSALSLFWALMRGEKADRHYINDLLAPATLLNDEIDPLLASLRKTNSLLSGMSGSGSAVFALFKSEKEATEAASTLSCKTLVTHTISPSSEK